MRYANNINALASRTSRLKASRNEPQQSVAMVTAANEQIRVAVFCDASFNVELSHQIAEQILQRFASSYTSTLKELEPAFAEEANDQNEARTKLKYMKHFKDFVGDLNKLVEKHPKSTLFSQATITSSEDTRSRIGSRLEEADEKAGQVAPIGQSQDTVKKEKTPSSSLPGSKRQAAASATEQKGDGAGGAGILGGGGDVVGGNGGRGVAAGGKQHDGTPQLRFSSIDFGHGGPGLSVPVSNSGLASYSSNGGGVGATAASSSSTTIATTTTTTTTTAAAPTVNLKWANVSSDYYSSDDLPSSSKKEEA